MRQRWNFHETARQTAKRVRVLRSSTASFVAEFRPMLVVVARSAQMRASSSAPATTFQPSAPGALKW